MTRPALLLATLALFAAPPADAASCEDASSADLFIVNARLPGADTGVTTISISGERICAIGREQPEAATTIDARGLTLMPGLIDAHVHLFPMGSRAGVDDDAALERFVRDELPARMRAYLERGVTTLFSVGDAWPAVRELRGRIASGEITGPRLLLTGPILTAPGGYPAVTICADSPWCRARLTVELRDADHARRTVRELAADGVDAIKIVYDDVRAEKLDASLIRVVADAAHALGLPVVAHTTTVRDALDVTELGADVLAHLPSGGAVTAADAAQLRQRGVVVITTAGVYAPIVDENGKRRTVFGLGYGPPFDRLHAQGLVNARALLEHGVPLAFGSGTAMFGPARSLDVEIAALSRVPLAPAQILDAMTIDAARALGREAGLGSIAVGKRADLVMVNTDTGATIVSADIVVVIKDGLIVVDRRETRSEHKEKS